MFVKYGHILETFLAEKRNRRKYEMMWHKSKHDVPRSMCILQCDRMSHLIRNAKADHYSRTIISLWK